MPYCTKVSGHTVCVAKHLKTRLCSKSFDLKQLSNSFVCEIPKFKADFILKFKVACVATCTLVMNCYSHDLLVLS